MRTIIFLIAVIASLSSCKKDTSSFNHSETIYVRVQEMSDEGAVLSTTNYVTVKID